MSVGSLIITIIFIIIVVTYRVYVYRRRSGIMYMQVPVDEPLPGEGIIQFPLVQFNSVSSYTTVI